MAKLFFFKLTGAFLILILLQFYRLQAQQSVGIGTTSPNPNAILDISSETQGLLVPRLTTAQRNTLAGILQASQENEGMLVFDLDEGKLYYWFKGAWREGGGSSSSLSASGDLAGTYPAPLVIGLRGRPISATAPTENQILKWNGTEWYPTTDQAGNYTPGAGISIESNKIINTGDVDSTDDVLITDLAGGDLSGNFSNLQIRSGVVANSKIATNAITTDKIIDGTITNADLNKTAIPLSGFGAATSNIDLGSQKLVGVADPTAAQDAATKSYVDAQIGSAGELTEGNILLGNNLNEASELDASGDGNILVGDGTSINSVAISGDISLASDGSTTISTGAVGSAEIADGAITSGKIFDGAIQSADLADASVTNAKLGTGSVTGDKILDGTIENADLAANAVTTDKISDGTIADADLNKTAIPMSGFGAATSNVDLGNQKLISVADPTAAQDAATKSYVDARIDDAEELTEGNILLGNNLNKASELDASGDGNVLIGDGTSLNSVAISGDISLAVDGSTAIGSGAVGTTKIADGAITSGKIFDGAIQSADLSDESVTNTKLGTGSVTGDKILDGTIENSDLASNAITTDKIADGTIVDADMNKTAIPLSGFGAATSNVDLGSQKLVSVADPTAAQDAATKSYVDAQIVSAGELTEGNILLGNNLNEASELDASGDGNILIGDGTSLNSVAISGDISLASDGSTAISSGAVGTAEIADGAITSGKIFNGTIQSADLADASITNTKLGTGAVTGAKILDGTIENTDLAANSVTTDKLTDGTITNADLNKTAIPLSGFGAATSNIDLGSQKLVGVADPTAAQDVATKSYVDAQIVSAGELTEGNILLGNNLNEASELDASGDGHILVGDGTSINSVAISGDISLTSDGSTAISSGAVGTAEIAEDAITSGKIFDGAIQSADLADESITNTKLGTGSVTGGKILDGTIENTDLAANAITTDKITDGTIANADLNKTAIPLSGFSAATSDVDLGSQKLVSVADPTAAQDAATKSYVDAQIISAAELTEGNILLGNNLNVASELDASGDGNILIGDGTSINSFPISGDISLASDGSTTISSGAVGTTKIADGAITSGKIFDGAIQSADLADASITNAKLGTGAVTGAKILDGTIENEDLAANAITTDKISDGSVTNTDLNKTAIPLSGFGAATSDVDLGSQKLVSVADPTAAQDAATKSYVDAQIISAAELTEGNILLGNNLNVASELDASGDGNILIGDGTSINSFPISGDISLASDGSTAINTDAVGTTEIADGAITSDKILDGTITNDDLADGSIDFEKMTQSGANQGQVMVWSNGLGKWTPGNATSILGFSGDITAVVTPAGGGLQGGVESGDASLSLINSGTAEILIGDGTNVNSTTITGDISLSSIGVSTLTTDAVQTANIEDDAVATAKIADGAVTGGKIAGMSAVSGEALKWNGSMWQPLPDAVDDADADPSNEIQTLDLTGNSLTISGGNAVTLSSSTPAENQVLTWQAGEWKAATVSEVSTQTQYYSVDPLDFQGIGKDGSQKVFYYNGSSDGEFVSSDENSGIAAPMHLPHGAIVESITFFFRDSHPTFDMNFLVQRKERAGAGSQNLASYSSSGAPGTTNAEVTSISNATIDNQMYSYRIIARIEKGGYDGAMHHRVYSVVVEYTNGIP